jgi:dihydroneopterin aldolase
MTADTRRLFLRGYRVMTNIGIHEFEKAGPQALLINVDLELRPHAGALDDDIANVLDYDALRAEIGTLARSRHFNLQETLVHEILDICMGRPQVVRARVSSEKPDVYPDCAAVGYEATRSRA